MESDNAVVVGMIAQADAQATQIAALQREIVKLTRQRNVLIEITEKILAQLKPGRDSMPHVVDRRALLLAILAARATFAAIKSDASLAGDGLCKFFGDKLTELAQEELGLGG